MNWKDTSSYSRGQTDRVPHCWTLKIEEISIDVINAHRDDPGAWVMHCYALGIEKRWLKIPRESTPEQAQSAAIKIVKDHVYRLTDIVNLL